MLLLRPRALLLCMVGCFFGLSSAIAQTNSVSGQLVMPSGVVPVSSSATFKIQTVPLESFRSPNGDQVETSTTVTIERLGSSVAYAIPLKDSTPSTPLEDRQRKIEFECIAGCANIAITSTGFWGGLQGITSEQDALELDSAVSQSLNIQLERADLFSGVIQLPSGLSASGDEVFTVSVVGSQFINPSVFSQSISAAEGEARWRFFIGVPASETGGGWTVNLNCDACSEQLISGPFYATTSAGNPLSLVTDNQFFFLKNRTYSNMRLSLLAVPRPPSISPVISILLDE